MGYKRSRAATQAWSLLRLALLWARKGGVLKCRLMSELRQLKALHRHSSISRRRLDGLHYGERELSFDETPIIRLGMSRPGSLRFKLPNLPCIKPSVVDFEYEFDDEQDEIYRNSAVPDEDESEGEYYCDHNAELVVEEEEEEEGIDKKADEFIERFYKQMRMQRQISYLEYEEMLIRGTN